MSKKLIYLVCFVLVLGLVAGVDNADFGFGTPTNLGPTVNSSFVDGHPSISADGLTLYFQSTRPGGYGNRDLYVTTRATTNHPWSAPVNLGPTINSSAKDGGSSISADGLSLYFNSGRPGGSGSFDLWVTTRATTNEPWGEPVNLGPTVNSSYNDAAPDISADGLELYFVSGRPGGYGGNDLWVVTRNTTDDDWGAPLNLGPIVNSSSREWGPNISADSLTLFFASRRTGGSGGSDLWVTTRKTKEQPWAEPVNLGSTVNSSAGDGGASISSDSLMLYFASDRPGGFGRNDLWQVSLEVSGVAAVEDREDFETGDFNTFPWEHYGDTSWTVTSWERYSGTYSAKAGAIDHDYSTTLWLKLDCVSGNITFYRKVSSESGFDYLKFYIDGVEKDKWSGTEDWAEVSFPVTAGTRTFEWTYSKDGSISEGEDTAWIDDIVTVPTTSNTPPATWQEHWFEHNQLLQRVYHNDNVAIYYDGDMSRSITWPYQFMTDVWRYTKSVYGNYGGENRLYAIFHQGKYAGGHPSTYFDASHDYRNVTDIGSGSWYSPSGWNIDACIHEVSHIVEGASNGMHNSPAFELWGDSKWAEIYIYDVYKGIGWNSEASRWYNNCWNITDNFPRNNTRWFRDWFYPIYRDYGGSAVLANFFKLLAQYFPKNGYDYARNMNWGEFVHFWSGSAGVNLKPLATTAFGWPSDWETQFTQAQIDFPAVMYH